MGCMTVDELKPGMKILYRQGDYTYISPNLSDRRLAYAKHDKTGIIKRVTIKKIRLRENENQVN